MGQVQVVQVKGEGQLAFSWTQTTQTWHFKQFKQKKTQLKNQFYSLPFFGCWSLLNKVLLVMIDLDKLSTHSMAKHFIHFQIDY